MQASRGAARKAACANNLRQFGTATGAYVARGGALPDGANLSAQGRLLDDLGARPLGRAVRDAEAAGSKFEAFGGPLPFDALVTPPAFDCPADPLAAARPGGISYLGNFGTGRADRRV